MICTVQAGTIACVNGQLNGGRGLIPVHNPEFSVNGQTFIGGPSQRIVGDGRSRGWPSSNYGGSGSSATATFWITSDSCMNIMTSGTHYFCCPGKINQAVMMSQLVTSRWKVRGYWQEHTEIFSNSLTIISIGLQSPDAHWISLE